MRCKRVGDAAGAVSEEEEDCGGREARVEIGAVDTCDDVLQLCMATRLAATLVPFFWSSCVPRSREDWADELLLERDFFAGLTRRSPLLALVEEGDATAAKTEVFIKTPVADETRGYSSNIDTTKAVPLTRRRPKGAVSEQSQL